MFRPMMGTENMVDRLFDYFRQSYPEDQNLTVVSMTKRSQYCGIYPILCERYDEYFPGWKNITASSSTYGNGSALLDAIAETNPDIVMMHAIPGAFRNDICEKYWPTKQWYFKHLIWAQLIPNKESVVQGCRYHITLESYYDLDVPEERYEDRDNGVALFPSNKDKGLSSGRVFKEWYYEKFYGWAGRIKPNETEFRFATSYAREARFLAGLYFIHKGVILARIGNSKSLKSSLRHVGYFPTFTGTIGTGKDNKNHMQSFIVSQTQPLSLENGTAGIKKIYSPVELQQTNIIYKAPTWDDYDCFPDCPECYDDNCSTMSNIIYIMFAIITALTFIFGGIFKCSLGYDHFIDAVLDSFRIWYSFLEIGLSITAVISIYSVRKSMRPSNMTITHIIAVISSIDGLAGIVSLVYFSMYGLDSKEIKYIDVFTVWKVFAAAANTAGIILYLKLLNEMTVQTSNSVAIIIDLTMNIVEIILVVIAEEFSFMVQEIEKSFIDINDKEVKDDEELKKKKSNL